LSDTEPRDIEPTPGEPSDTEPTPGEERGTRSSAAEPEAAQPIAPETDAPETDAPEQVAPEQVAPEQVAPEPVAREPVALEPVAEQQPDAAERPDAAEPDAERVAPEPFAEQPDAAEPDAAEEPDDADGEDEDEEGYEEIEIRPRVRPEIPGADLEPDLIPEGEEYLDAEAQAAAEAEAEEARARAEAEDDQTTPIADATIDLAAGARYTATGKRKTAVARVILKPGSGTYSINGRELADAFPRDTLQRMIRQPLETVGYESRMDVVARLHGGGVSAQAGALRHGISRALIVADPKLRGELKRRGFLTRDPRVKERKKAGLKKARKRPQFSKR
jgi:small subunit ribosomal protein S9